MKEYKRKFIEYALNKNVLKFGKFTLKSGRISPYFFNTGLFKTGYDLVFLGHIYAKILIKLDINFDVLFGLSYKGIPIVTATAIALATKYQRDINYCFNRKEIKTYGEGSIIIGSKLYGKVILIDDVITAGTAIHESIEIIKAHQAKLAGVIISLDRQEKGYKEMSAIEEIKQTYHCKVVSIITLADLIDYLKENNTMTYYLSAVRKYQQQYCI